MAGYGDDDKFEQWLTDNGYVLPDDAPSPAVLRQRGSAYVDGAYENRFVGVKTEGYEQERSWPRTGATLRGGNTVPDDVVPVAVEQASYEAALQEAREPDSLSLIGSSADRIKRARVEGAVEVEYQDAGTAEFASTMLPVMTAVEGLLTPFLCYEIENRMGLFALGGSSGNGGCSGQTV